MTGDARASAPRIILAGGGTGGHLSPGLAVATEFARRLPGARVLFLGTGRPVEEHMIPAAGFELRVMPAVKLPRRLHEMPLFPFRLWSAVRRAKTLLAALEPAIVIGLGGYASYPAAHAAHSLGVPVVLLEQNSVPGRANRRLARIADEVYVQFACSCDAFAHRERVHVLGNPLREGITGGDRGEALRKFNLSNDLRTLVVLGGSQGARRINQAVCDALDVLAASARVQLIHQTGVADLEWVRERHAASGVRSHVAAFIDDMPGVLAGADLVVGRAGATTLAEIAAVALPSVLVPYPSAADDHQTRNARVYVDAGAAVLVRDADLDANSLSELVKELIVDDARRRVMGDAARSLAKPNATRDVCDRIVNLMKRTRT